MAFSQLISDSSVQQSESSGMYTEARPSEIAWEVYIKSYVSYIVTWGILCISRSIWNLWNGDVVKFLSRRPLRSLSWGMFDATSCVLIWLVVGALSSSRWWFEDSSSEIMAVFIHSWHPSVILPVPYTSYACTDPLDYTAHHSELNSKLSNARPIHTTSTIIPHPSLPHPVHFASLPCS